MREVCEYHPKLYVKQNGHTIEISGVIDDYADDNEVIQIMKSRANDIGININTYNELVSCAPRIGFNISESNNKHTEAYDGRQHIS